MTLLFVIILFGFLGACVGSFCGVLSGEPQKDRSIWTGRSECLSCKKFLSWYELIPIVSYCIQKGRCRKCHVHIPLSVLFIEIIMSLVWIVLGTSLFLSHASITEISIFLILASGITLLACTDLESFLIPDRLSLPLIFVTLCIMFFNNSYHLTPLLPSLSQSLLGGFVGLNFYLLQMIIPVGIHTISHKKIRKTVDALLLPIIAPLWIFVRMFFGEKRADTCFPAFSVLDEFPTWAGGGDLRLGLLVGLILGPWDFFIALAIGYTVGSCIWIGYKIFSKKTLEILPVAPLLGIGVIVTWMIQ